MIKQLINVDNYWKVIVYYNVDYNFFNDIVYELRRIDIDYDVIDDIYENLIYTVKAATCSSYKYKTSIVLFNNHKNSYDYINSIVHEAEHIKQHMLSAYKVLDEGEPPAYTIGYVAMKMLMINNKLNLL